MNEMEKWIRSKVGCGYVYGATGWICTEDRLEQQAQQYPDYVDIEICRKWIGKECYDCAQLIRQALKSVGIAIPSGATSQWNADVWLQKGTISDMPDVLCALYRQEGSRMQHTGWHLGGGVTVDARGSSQGVIKSTADKYPWTHYAIPKGLEGGSKDGTEDGKEAEEMAHYLATVATQKDPLRMREYPVNGEVIGHAPKGSTVEVIGEEETGWTRIRYGALVGYASSAYLKRIEDDALPGTVAIPRALAREIYEALGKALQV